MITAHNLTHHFGTHLVIDGVDLDAPDHGTVGLVGPNGSGKTTLLRTLYGALRPEHGHVTVDGADLHSLGRKHVARSIAVVGQETETGMPTTVADVVILGRLPHQSLLGGSTARDREVATAALEEVGASHLAQRDIASLSGGERKRVMIARALAQQTDHILLDEPTNHLDVRYQHEVLDLVSGLPASVIVVLHDLNLAATYCTHLVLVSEGKIVIQGSPSEVLTPENLEPVYGVKVRRLDLEDGIHLVFRKQQTYSPALTPGELSQ